MENNRASFGSNFGFIMAAVGSAVGLGNIWGFPYKMGLNGGFAFLVVYLVLAIFVGLAVMVGEFTIGRKTGMSPVAAYRKLSKKFTWMGYMAVIVPFLVLCFYFVLGGMVMRYAISYLTAIFGWNTWGVKDVTTFFGTFILNGGQMILWTAIFIALNAIIVAAGVGGGIEKFCNIGMPALFVMLIIVIVYVAVQPGAMDGYKFMFGWNVEPL
ncbi:MAG: sodium-dependent transporter, partial [Eubacteriales bacterium]|nr:sodium-dependent transporter [Eubacteriales bacterium]